jgi:hypothetical protein
LNEATHTAKQRTAMSAVAGELVLSTLSPLTFMLRLDPLHLRRQISAVVRSLNSEYYSYITQIERTRSLHVRPYARKAASHPRTTVAKQQSFRV